ncbi:MAG: ABC transporter ATP-binding protein [Spirochaetota bacterium]
MISVSSLTQVYRNGKGVFDLTFTVEEGEVFGYLGPNGAGKTTTIRNLLGFMNANGGGATIMGKDCRARAAELQNDIGYLPRGEIEFFENMTGIEFLTLIGDLRRMNATARRDDLIDRFELDPSGRINRMSKGMKQKLAVVTAFMHDPPVYILDEPTSGLDPFMQNVFMNLLRSEKERGKTVLMSSHIFEEVQRICDRAGIIKEGRLVTVEDVQSLGEARQKSYVVTLADSSDVTHLREANVDLQPISEHRVIVTVRNNYRDLFRALARCDVQGLESRSESLEDVFMKYYGQERNA